MKHAPVVLALGSVFAILAVTLYPTGQVLPAGGWECLLCDPRATADFLANVLLFVPPGAALALMGWRTRSVLAVSMLLTGFIEVTQLLFLPGRDASVVDALANSSGGLCGAVVAGWLRARWGRGALLPRGMLLLPPLVVLLTAVLLRPAPTTIPYQIRWEESPGGLEPYGGRVERALLGGVDLPRQQVVPSSPIRQALGDGSAVALRLIAGPPAERLSHIFSLHDVRNREVLLVAADGEDLVVRYRARAAALRLDQPSHRWVGALSGVAPGGSLDLVIRHSGARICASVGGAEHCGFGPGVGRGWSFLLFAEGFPQRLVQLLDVAWLALLTMPVGALIRRDWTGVLPLLAPAVVIAAPLLGLPPLRGTEWLGLAIGLVSGIVLRQITRPSHGRRAIAAGWMEGRDRPNGALRA